MPESESQVIILKLRHWKLQVWSLARGVDVRLVLMVWGRDSDVRCRSAGCAGGRVSLYSVCVLHSLMATVPARATLVSNLSY